MKTLKSIRTVQKSDIKDVCPFGNVAKVETSEYDLKMPKSELFNVKAMNFDGFSSEVEFIFDDKTESAKFRFEPIEKNLVHSGVNYLTDGNIGTLIIENENQYLKHKVYSTNLKEFYIHLGSAEVTDATVNYYLQLIHQ